jgi:hypothetical protein
MIRFSQILTVSFLSLMPANVLAQEVSQLAASGNMFFAQCAPSQSSYTACVFYVLGLTDGLNIANSLLEHYGQKQMYCLPSAGNSFFGKVTGVQIVDMVMTYLQRNPQERHKPTLRVLVDTFKEAFSL